MIEKITSEGKNIDEAINNILTQNNLTKDDIIIINEDEKSSLFKGKKAIITIIKKEDIKQYLKQFFKQLDNYLNVNIKCEILERDNIYDITLTSDNNAILIGKDGKNLEAIQVIVRNIINQNTNNSTKINIDVSNYKTSKMEKLEKEIEKIAKEVQNTKVAVKLDPMNSYQRMIVHTHISKYEDLISESIGEEPERYIVIKPKED